jgi:hypothetical protein
VQSLLAPSQNAEAMRSLSIALIVFGTLASALAVSAVRRDGVGLLSRVSEYFFGDRKAATRQATSTPSKTDTPEATTTPAKTSRREIDNFDLSIFEDF